MLLFLPMQWTDVWLKAINMKVCFERGSHSRGWPTWRYGLVAALWHKLNNFLIQYLLFSCSLLHHSTYQLPHTDLKKLSKDARWCSVKCLDSRKILPLVSLISDISFLGFEGQSSHQPQQHLHEPLKCSYQCNLLLLLVSKKKADSHHNHEWMK